MPGDSILPEPPREPEPARRSRVRAGMRGLGLGAIAFVATLVLLAGTTRLIDRQGAGANPSSSTDGIPIASARPSGPPSPGVSAAPDGSPVGNPSPTTDGDPVLVGAGDIGDCGSPGDEATAALLDGIAGTVFTTGDNAYGDGTADQFRDCYGPNWGRHLDRTRPAPGNHDWETEALGGYFGYFGDAARGPNGSSWYSYDLGAWHVIVLDSSCANVGGCGGGSPQMTWLEADLAASGARCTIALWHHPRFSSGFHGNAVGMDPFWRSLYAAGVDVVVNGHDHDYERFAPQDPDGREDRARGIRQFVVGTGGTGLRPFEDPIANSELRLADVHGVIAFTLHPSSYDWSFMAAGSDIGDRGTANCN